MTKNNVSFLAKKSITNMGHQPYSLNLVSCDFWLFPKLKSALKRQRSIDIPDIECNVMLLQGILGKNFQDCFWQWHHRLTKRLASQGGYLVGDRSR
jgi:hypothetical protein